MPQSGHGLLPFLPSVPGDDTQSGAVEVQGRALARHERNHAPHAPSPHQTPSSFEPSTTPLPRMRRMRRMAARATETIANEASRRFNPHNALIQFILCHVHASRQPGCRRSGYPVQRVVCLTESPGFRWPPEPGYVTVAMHRDGNTGRHVTTEQPAQRQQRSFSPHSGEKVARSAG